MQSAKVCQSSYCYRHIPVAVAPLAILLLNMQFYDFLFLVLTKSIKCAIIYKLYGYS